MFLLYINDLPDCLPPCVHCSVYADDLKLYAINNPQGIQPALNAILDWSSRWQLEISREKTSVMFIGASHPAGYRFYLGSHELQVSTKIPDLGVTYTHDLRFDPYIDKIVNTAHAKSNYILKAFSTRKMETLYKLFLTYVRPILEYCTPIWSPSKKLFIDAVENVQKRFTYRIFARNGLFRISYKERLKRLNTTSLLLRRVIFDQNLVYKTVTSGVDVNLEELFTFCNFNGRTRGHQLRLVVEKAHTQQFHVSFLVRAAKMWNDLPESIVLSSSPTSFNRKLEALLKKRGLH
ncbi:hypothetical protein Y032_0052g2276 [Ancylostoma ceylanicum]|uniref:Reverse transcriptase domain-containing protein n=1 Tax=Ancylostoma ceylanicum TaxID=53326 RepID=A0A016U9A1_9BILA|nr:hypothetical protein Y032_0052g2276 [Ancylostoma ceylanicum]